MIYLNLYLCVKVHCRIWNKERSRGRNRGWLVVLGFNATLTAKVISWRSVFPGFLTRVLTQLYFQSHRLLFAHASAEARGENKPERKFASTRFRTHNHQVIETGEQTVKKKKNMGSYSPTILKNVPCL